MKFGKADGPSEVGKKKISANGELGIGVMTELRQRAFDGCEMPDEWQTRE